jgi:hypothetical protein
MIDVVTSAAGGLFIAWPLRIHKSNIKSTTQANKWKKYMNGKQKL